MKRLLLSLAGLLLLLGSANAQVTYPVNGPSDPRHTLFAFTHCRIHVDYRTVVDSATLLVRDGIIQDVGKEIQVPADAVVYDLGGKTIYPSFIDLHSDYGMPEVKRPGYDETASPQFLSNTKGAYDWNQAVRPEGDAFRIFSADNKRSEELRKLGFGSALCVSRDGVVRGTAVFALTGNGKENDLIVRDRAAACFSFDKGSSTQDYPSSTMGSIALLRQTFYDAQWYKSGGDKKEYNISLDAFNRLNGLPFVFEAGDKQNELRVANIGKEFDVDFIVKGNGDEYERIKEIKESGMRFIVPLNFPEAFDLSDPYDAANVSLHDLKAWELAPGNAATMESARIEFAFTLSGLKNRADFWKNMRKAIDYGLSEQQALKSLTYAPAVFLGQQDKIGALRRGMIANFIITTGNVFQKETVILENWVKGVAYRMYDPQQKDIRGNYTLSIKGQTPLRVRIAGEPYSAEMTFTEDTAFVKATGFSRTGQLIGFSIERKSSTPKGPVRCSGTMDGAVWNGAANLSDGAWTSWTMTYDSAITTQTKKDSLKGLVVERGKVTFPNMAYGWDQLP
ncbi:MAG: amidohydrolase family protein, partial [Bacteroidota bacterium]